MATRTGFLAFAAAAVVLAGALPAPPGARAQDGLPDLAGSWAGTSKGKEASLDPGGTGGTHSSPFTVGISQEGAGLAATLVSEGRPPLDLAGVVGNGNFWLVADDAGSPFLLSGHADAKAARLKGGFLSGNPEYTMDGKFTAAKSPVPGKSAAPLLLRPAAASKATAPAPGLAGAWSGTMSGTTFSLETGVKPDKLRVPVTLTASVAGTDASFTLTLHWPEGDDVVALSGKSGNGAFWATNGDPDAPVLIAGSVAGKDPRLKLKARGIRAGPLDFAEVTLSLKKSPAGLQGTAAAGAPVAGATVTLKDREGTAVTAVTGEGGAFVLDAAGLTPPFLLKVDLPAGGSLYGVATEAGVANLHPLTDLILHTWYALEGTDLETAFATLGPSTPMPTAIEIDLLEKLVRRAIQKWLEDQGIDPGTFDLIRSAFAADGTGFDAVLDGTSVAPDGSSLTISDGTTTQDSAFTLSSVSGTVTVDTTVTSAAGTSTSRDGTALPGAGEMEQAVAGALAAMQSFAAKVNSRGAALTAADLAPFLTEDFLDRGESRTVWTAESATQFRGATLGTVGLRSVASYNPGTGIVVLEMTLPMTLGDFQENMKFRMPFKRTGSAWLLHGDRLITEVNFGVEFRTDVSPRGVDGPRRHINLDVDPPKGTVQSVTITGGGLFSGTALTKGPDTRLVTLMPTPKSEMDVEYDLFYTGLDVADFPAPGTPFFVTVTPVSGPPQVYTVLSGATTTETVSVLQPTGTGLAADAHPGTPFTARWTRPTTFAVDRIEFSGTGYSANFAKDVPPDAPVATTATEGTVTIPATAGGETVTAGDFYLSFEGPNGEKIVIIHRFE